MAIIGQGQLQAGMGYDYVYVFPEGIECRVTVQPFPPPTAIFRMDVYDEEGNQIDTAVASLPGLAVSCSFVPIVTSRVTIRVRCLQGYGAYSIASEP